MARQKDLGAYEDRYRLVFAAGAVRWNDPRPNPHLVRALSGVLAGSRCIEFGCGEGYQTHLMASMGFRVTGIDMSATAIAKARSEAPQAPRVEFLTGDVTDSASLKLPHGSYDMAVDIGCLHMLVDEWDRAAYLQLVHNVLKPGGKFFLQNGLDLDDVDPESEEEARRIDELRRERAGRSGSPSTRTIMTAKGAKELSLPLLPARMVSLKSYARELENHGLTVVY